MINFDAYRHNPTAAATLIAREGDCGCCPMCNKCDSAPDHDDYDKCFEMWTRFFKFSPETLGSVDDFSELLSIMIDCDKCIVKKLNECDFSETKDCGLTFCKWLCEKIPTWSARVLPGKCAEVCAEGGSKERRRGLRES